MQNLPALPISISELPPKADNSEGTSLPCRLCARNGKTLPGRRANSTRDCAFITRFQFAHNVNGGVATGGGCNIDLRVTIVRSHQRPPSNSPCPAAILPG